MRRNIPFSHICSPASTPSKKWKFLNRWAAIFPKMYNKHMNDNISLKHIACVYISIFLFFPLRCEYGLPFLQIQIKCQNVKDFHLIWFCKNAPVQRSFSRFLFLSFFLIKHNILDISNLCFDTGRFYKKINDKTRNIQNFPTFFVKHLNTS